MTDSENSQPQNDSDEDIYKDIPEFNFEDELAKLEGSKETYKQEASDLSEKVKLLAEENEELKKANEVLKKNLSTLLKTAQAEVQRKDSMILELKTKVESFTFRRNKTVTKEKYTSTNDFEFSNVVKCEPEKHKSASYTKKAKSFDYRTNNESELKANEEEQKGKESSAGKEDYSNCDNDRKSGRNSNFRHSDSYDRHREKSSRFENSTDYRRSYRRDRRDVLKCDSFDKKRHSRSSDSRFLSRRRSSRDRKSDRSRRGSSERRRSVDSSERSRKKKGRSRSREVSRGSTEALEKPKSRSSYDKDPVGRVKVQVSNRAEVTNGAFSEVDEDKKTKRENPERREDTTSKTKQSKEKRVQRQEKNSLDIFSTKSPLDALYSEMVNSKSSTHSCGSKSGTSHRESDLEEGEISSTIPGNQAESSGPAQNQSDEDWAFSFKNERRNDPKPMTLYSRRMMWKLSSELSSGGKKEEKVKPEEDEKLSKIVETEKEPGELTDDENVVESSQEFQELTKVASIDIVEKPVEEIIFKEPIRRDSKVEPPVEKPREDPGKEMETNKETREVIEFSPFKNNYKLIEISPIKPHGKEHILDFYNQRPPQIHREEPAVLESSETMTESERSTNKLSDTSEEKISESELKIVTPPKNESPQEKENKTKNNEDSRKKTEGKSKDSNSGKGKRKAVLKKETEKRKRECSETREGNTKKRKIEEPTQRNLRNKRNSKTEVKLPTPEPEKKDISNDISGFEFFKPFVKADAPETPVDSGKSASTTTDYKMTATMSLTGVVRLETPDKCMEKLKNLMINEHMIFNVLDSKNNSQFSPLIGSKCIEMTPRRMLKNDLMLTDSEDDSVCKRNTNRGEEEEEVEEEDGDETTGSENSECDSDSGASDFVDML